MWFSLDSRLGSIVADEWGTGVGRRGSWEQGQCPRLPPMGLKPYRGPYLSWVGGAGRQILLADKAEGGGGL